MKVRPILRLALFALFLPVLFLIALAGWRIDSFQILDKTGNMLFAAPSRVGNVFTTRYIHSVEKTPVEDEYRILGGRIWMWEERVRSSNAGLPSVRPVNGRFIATPEWFIYQGGRSSVEEYYYRVGDDRFGLNQANFEPFGRRNFYDVFKGERLLVRIRRTPFLFSKFYISDRLALLPASVPAVTQGPR